MGSKWGAGQATGRLYQLKWKVTHVVGLIHAAKLSHWSLDKTPVSHQVNNNLDCDNVLV